MSTTPRTDAFYSGDFGMMNPTQAAFARGLEHDLGAAKARAEKAEAGMKEQCDTCELKCVFDSDRRFAEKCKADNDALRKALEQMYSAMLRYQSDAETEAPPEHRTMIFEVEELLALHGTAKQDPKPRTCGECAFLHGEDDCKSPGLNVWTDRKCEACHLFTPRADAQKEGNA